MTEENLKRVVYESPVHGPVVAAEIERLRVELAEAKKEKSDAFLCGQNAKLRAELAEAREHLAEALERERLAVRPSALQVYRERDEARRELAEAKRTIQGELSDPNGSIWEAHSAALRRAEKAEQALLEQKKENDEVDHANHEMSVALAEARAKLAAYLVPIGGAELNKALAAFDEGAKGSVEDGCRAGFVLARAYRQALRIIAVKDEALGKMDETLSQILNDGRAYPLEYWDGIWAGREALAAKVKTE